MPQAELKYQCSRDPRRRFMSQKTCQAQMQKAKEKPGKPELWHCERCQGPVEIDAQKLDIPTRQARPLGPAMNQPSPPKAGGAVAEAASPAPFSPPPPQRAVGARPKPGSSARRGVPKEPDMSDTPKCKHHPDRDAVLHKNGQNSGRCRECLDRDLAKMNQAKAASTRQSYTRKKSMPRLDGQAIYMQFWEHVDELKANCGSGSPELIAAAAGIIAVLGIMEKSGLLPQREHQA